MAYTRRPARKVAWIKSSSLFLSALLATTFLTGCPDLEEDTPSQSQSGAASQAPTGSQGHTSETSSNDKTFTPEIGKAGGSRMISSTSLPKTFNAYLAAETSSTDVIAQMYLGLVSTDPVTTKVIPSLAESWTISKDNMTYTFKLRKDLKWSDGKPLTADDVVFTYLDIINNDKIPNNYRDGLLIEDHFPKVEKVDDLTIRFTTIKPFVPFLRGLSDPIMPKHVLGNSTKPDASGKIPFNEMWGLGSDVTKIVCSGPWKIGEYLPGQRVVLSPNEHYYVKDKQGQKLPYLEKFTTIEVQDLNTSIIKFKASETDALSLRSEDYDGLEPEQSTKNFKIHNLGPATGTLFVMFNMSTAINSKGQPVVNPIKSAWFRDVKFRQAMAHAINKDGIIDSIYKGRAMPQTSHISQQNPFYNPNVKNYAYDLQKADELLTAAGYKKNDKGERTDSKGNRIEFNLVTNAGNTERDATCAILRKDWAQLGIKGQLQAIQFNVMVNQIDQSLDWEAMMIGLTGSAIEPHFGINTWKEDGRMHMFNMGHPRKWKGKGTTYSSWEKEILDLYEKAAVEFDFEKRKALYWKAQDIAADNLPFLFTVNQLALVAVRNNIGNVRPSIHGGSALNQVNWNTDYHFIKP